MSIKMKKRTLPHIEVVLPIFNEVKNILPLVDQLDAVKRQLAEQASMSYLFVDDGSIDGSNELLQRLFRERDDIRIVDLIHNFGHGAGITCGLKYFKGDIAILMDADLQDDPAAIPEMFAKWKQGARTVVAERGTRKERNQFLFRAFYFVLHKITRAIPPIQFGTFSLLDRSVVGRFMHLRERNRYFPGLLSYASEQIHSVRVNRNPRAHGKSRVGTLGLVQLAITAFVSFSSTPIRVVSFLGLMAAAGAFFAAFAIISVRLFTEHAIPGWASTMTAVAFASAVQLLCLGIIGEYVARMYDEVKRRPLFLVDKIYEKRTEKATEAA